MTQTFEGIPEPADCNTGRALVASVELFRGVFGEDPSDISAVIAPAGPEAA